MRLPLHCNWHLWNPANQTLPPSGSRLHPVIGTSAAWFPRLLSLTILAATVACLGSVGALQAQATNPVWLAPANPGAHAWSSLGGDSSRRGYSSVTGPEDASIRAPWPFKAGGPIQSSAVIDRRQWIYFGADDGYVYALRPAAANSAALLDWRFDAGSRVIGSPALAADADGQTLIYAAAEAGTVYGLRDDGSMRWQIDLGDSIVSSLALRSQANEVWLYVKAGANLVALRDQLGSNTVSVEWTQGLVSAPVDIDTSPALPLGGAWVAVTDEVGELSIFEATRGATLCGGIALGGKPTTPVIDSDGYLYVGLDTGSQGAVESYELNNNTFGWSCNLRFSTPLGGPVIATPALTAGKTLVVLDDRELLGLDVGTAATGTGGAILWSEPAPWAGAASPVTDGAGSVYVAGTDGRARAFQVSPGNLALTWQLLTDQAGKMAQPSLDGLGRLIVPSQDENLYVLQEVPAFQVAFDLDLTGAQPELHTLREIYGALDPTSNPWARILQLTSNAVSDRQPAYSLDGTLLAWSTADGGKVDVALASAGAREALVATADNGSGDFSASSMETDPAFSPVHPSRGSRIPDGRAYLTVTHDNGDFKDLRFLDLQVLLTQPRRSEDLQTWLARQLGLAPNSPTLVTLLPAGEHRAQAAFASDGDHLVYSACQPSSSGGGSGSDLYLVIQGLRQAWRQVFFTTQVSETCQKALEIGFAPAISPDGEHVVYHLYNGGLRVLAGNGSSLVLPDPAGAKPLFPTWSPDGTEIVASGDASGFFLAPQAFYTYQGPNYQSSSRLTAPLNATRISFGNPDHHPQRLPEPLLVPDCTQPGSAPPILRPARAQPGQTVEIFGCGFDIGSPERQQVEFVHALNPTLWVAGRVLASRVDVTTGLGVLTVEVPWLAGNGPVAISTPFGRAETGADPADCRDADSTNDEGCFGVEPLTTTLLQPETVVGAKIRVLGYGFQVLGATTPGDPRLNRVLFTDSNGQQTLGSNVSAVRLEVCGPQTNTPCPPGAPIDQDGQPRVEWLEVTVPPGTHPGPVRVTSAVDPTSGHSCCSLGLLEPLVKASPDNGSEGLGFAPGVPGGPTFFDLSGERFPFDPYFNYTSVELSQFSADGSSRANLSTVALNPAAPGSHLGIFTAAEQSVRRDATGQGGVLRMEAVGTGSGARASTPFRTPLRNLPIIFVPGTSGTFLNNLGPTPISWSPSGCFRSFNYPVMPPAVPGVITPSASPPADIWMSEQTILTTANLAILGLPLGPGCMQYLFDPVALSPTTSAPLFPAFAGIGPHRVIDWSPLPTLSRLPGVDPRDGVAYLDLARFLARPTTASPPGLGRAAGNPATGACPTNNCFYLFPMDWRMDYASQAARLDSLITGILAATGQPKVVVMGHSMGGAVLDYYIRTHPQAADRVDQAVGLGGGSLGVPSPYKILQKGDSWGLNKTFASTGLEVVDPDIVQQVAQNWPTAYWQMPSQAWFDDPNGACGGRCYIVWEDGWDVDGDGSCGSRNDGSLLPCSGPLARGTSGQHRHGTRTLNFIRDAPHDGCPGSCDGNPSLPGDQINTLKFGVARAGVLSRVSPATRSCFDDDGNPISASLGDWRCGTDGVFHHRIVGYGADTDGRLHFYKKTICSRKEVVVGILGGIFSGASPLIALSCLAKEERRDVVDIDGDATVPLRSAVGILDGFDDRIWAVDWNMAKRQPVYRNKPSGFHRHLPNDPLVHILITAIAGGRITNLSQLPVSFPGSSDPYFRVTRGNPNPVAGSPAHDALCAGAGICPQGLIPNRASLSTAATEGNEPALASRATVGREQADRLRIVVHGRVALHLFDDQGRHSGSIDDIDDSVFGLAPIPGANYSPDVGQVRASLPLDPTSDYRIELHHDGTVDASGVPIEEPFEIEIEGVRGREVLWIDTFQGIPLLAATTIEIPVGNATSAPQMVIDLMGDGNAVSVDAETLEGDAIDDVQRPETLLEVSKGQLILTATDEGGAGLDEIIYGFDRGQTAARAYEGPVSLPSGVRHVWAYSVDRAGNTEATQTWDAPECLDGSSCLVDLSLRFELFDGLLEPGQTVLLRAEVENTGETAAFASTLRLGLDPRQIRVDDINHFIGEGGNGGACDAFFGTTVCDVEILENGESFVIEIQAEILEGVTSEEALTYRLEALTGEQLVKPEAGRISGLLQPEE